jgi:poly(3-hydroxybutyrate) depolymerase
MVRRHEVERMTIRALLTLLVLAALAPLADARGGKVPIGTVSADGILERIDVQDPPGTVGYLYFPETLKEGEKGGLIVILHGHGGTPKGMVRRDLAEKRKSFILSVKGCQDVQTSQGPGHQWSNAGPERVLALTRWVLHHRAVDPARVVLLGFSAGGTVVLRTWPKAPKMFAGIVTFSSPAVPEKRHEGARIAVFLGTRDPNYSRATAVRNIFEKRKAGGAFFVVDEGGHNDIPHSTYLDLAIDWILEKKARGQESRVPKAPPTAVESTVRHIVVPWTRATGAPAGLKRKKSGAKSLARKIQKAVKGGKAWFPHEAQAHSSDRDTGAVGGRIETAKLKAFGGDLAEIEAALEKAKPGVIIGPFESNSGFHLVMRD